MKIILARLLLTSLILQGLCGCVSDEYVDAWNAQKRLSAAIEARRIKCGDSTAPFVPPIPHPVRRQDLALCEGEVLVGPCPFRVAPLACVLLLFKQAPEDQDGPL